MEVAVIVTVCPLPFCFVVTTPFWVTLAHFLREELHFTFLVVALEGDTVAVSFNLSPAFSVIFEDFSFTFFVFVVFLVFPEEVFFRTV